MVVGILYLTWWMTKKYALTMSGGRQSRYMKIIDKIAVAQDRFIFLISIGETVYVMGVAAGSITLLTKLDEDDLLPLEDQTEMPLQGVDFKELIQKIGGKKHGQ